MVCISNESWLLICHPEGFLHFCVNLPALGIDGVEKEIPRDHWSSQSSLLPCTSHRLVFSVKSELLSLSAFEAECFGSSELPKSKLARKFAVLHLSIGWNFLIEALIPTLKKSLWPSLEQRQKLWERMVVLVLVYVGSAGNVLWQQRVNTAAWF